jgi:glycosyltransferase involved in cell wall biosynthesis
MNKIKVLHLCSWYPNQNSSQGNFIKNQIEALSHFEEIEQLVFDCSQNFWSPHPNFFIFLKKLELKKFLKKNSFEPHIIHAHVSYPAGVLAQMFFKNKPIVLTEHTGPLSLLTKYFSSEKKFHLHFLKYKKIIAVSSFLKKSILNETKENLPIDVIGNVIANKYFIEPFSKADSSTPFHLLFIGRLTEEKGVPELIECIKELEKISSRNHLVDSVFILNILGDGSMKDNLASLDKDLKKIKIKFYDNLTSTPLDLYKFANLLILPSRIETFSMVSAEALAMGIPVIAFNCGGPEDFVVKDCGEILNDRSSKKMALRIFSFFSNSKEDQSLEKKALRRSFISNNFSADIVAKKIISFYRSLI